jgi:hypothetical protein
LLISASEEKGGSRICEHNLNLVLEVTTVTNQMQTDADHPIKLQWSTSNTNRANNLHLQLLRKRPSAFALYNTYACP